MEEKIEQLSEEALDKMLETGMILGINGGLIVPIANISGGTMGVFGQIVPGIAVTLIDNTKLTLCGRKETLKTVFSKLMEYINNME